MTTTDPTAFDLQAEAVNDPTDPLTRRIRGWTAHGNHKLDMPFMTQVADNLWHGGCQNGLVLPTFIDHVVSLYPWESYTVNHDLSSFVQIEMYDSVDQDFDYIEALANWVNVCRTSGPVLVHCQAGLNRSSLVVATALIHNKEVSTGKEAVELLREKRSPACLCNPSFEDWILGM